MIRLDLSWFYRLGLAIQSARQVRYDVPIADVFTALSDLRGWISIVRFDETIGPALRSTGGPAYTLSHYLDSIVQRPPESQFVFADWMTLLNHLNKFEAVLSSELAIASAYFVKEKEPYSTETLTLRGERLFPRNILSKVPEAASDLAEAGKCLAFEVPTAAAFHIHRATEAVLRRYWEKVTGNKPKPKTRSIGVFLAALKRLNCGDEKVIAALSQMNVLHRNPTIHPEFHLDAEEAIALIVIANSVVAAMLKEIPDITPKEPEIPFATPLPPITDSQAGKG